MRATVQDRLRERGGSLVGREAEVERLRALLGPGAGPSAVYVHGPGGVGKSAVLTEVERLAGAVDRPVRRVDAADLAPGTAALLAALAGVDEGAVPTPADLAERLPAESVLLVDRAEAVAGLDHWVVERLVPALPADCLLVLAGRRSPDAAEPLVRAGVLELLPLRNLTAVAAEQLLRICGVPDDTDVTDLVAATHGHPLALVIAADTWLRLPGSAALAAPRADLLRHPDPAARLLRRFVDDIDDPLQRRALQVAAHARRVDRVMLRGTLTLDDGAADELLQWLRDRPYSETHPDGLALHDVVRDAVEADLLWRDPEAYRAMHEGVRAVIVDRLRGHDPGVRHRAGTDLLFLHRANLRTEHLYGFDRLGTMSVRPATPAEEPGLLDLVRQEEGEARAAAVAHWSARQPGALQVMLGPDGAAVGAGLYARLSDADASARRDDPVAAAVWEELSGRRPVGPGEVVLLGIVVDALNPDRLGGVSDLMAVHSLVSWTVADLGWCALSSGRGPVWRPAWSYIGFEPLLTTTTPDGQEVEVWARDFARSPYDEWLAGMGELETDVLGQVPAPVAAPLALARPDFEDAVRRALRDFHAADDLALSPLLASSLVRRGADGSQESGSVERLREVILDAVADLEELPALTRAARAVDRTYLRRASTQEAAAEVLGLAFSTYRRHLAKGVDALVAELWARELHGVTHRTGRE